MSKERIWYDVENEDEKKTILLAFKNEMKFTKKVPVENEEGEVIARIIKLETYTNYIDFWLDNILCEADLKENGKIRSIELYDKETTKGSQKRIKKILLI